MIDDRTATAVGLGVTASITLWLALTPNIKDVYTADARDTNFAAPMQHAEMIAAITALGVGGIGSAMSHSSLPLVVSLLTVGVLYAAYEYTLFNPYSKESDYVEPYEEI